MNFTFSKRKKPKRLAVFQRAMDELEETTNGDDTNNQAYSTDTFTSNGNHAKHHGRHVATSSTVTRGQNNNSEVKPMGHTKNKRLNKNRKESANFIKIGDFNVHFQDGIKCATNGKYAQALRSFDLAVRFWGIKLENLKSKYNIVNDFIIDSSKLSQSSNDIDSKNIFNLISQTFNFEMNEINGNLNEMEHQDNDLLINEMSIQNTQIDKQIDNANDDDDDDDEIIYFENEMENDDSDNGNGNGNGNENEDANISVPNEEESMSKRKILNKSNDLNELQIMINEMKQLSNKDKNVYPCTNGTRKKQQEKETEEKKSRTDISYSNGKICDFVENNNGNLPEEIRQHINIGSELFEAQGQVLMEMDRYFDSIESCKQCIILRPNWAVGWLTLSRAELNWGDPIKAYKSGQYALHCANFQMGQEEQPEAQPQPEGQQEGQQEQKKEEKEKEKEKEEEIQIHVNNNRSKNSRNKPAIIPVKNNIVIGKDSELLDEIKQHCSHVGKIVVKYQELKESGQITDQQIYSRIVDNNNNNNNNIVAMDKKIIAKRMILREKSRKEHELRNVGKHFTNDNEKITCSLAHKLSKLEISNDKQTANKNENKNKNKDNHYGNNSDKDIKVK